MKNTNPISACDNCNWKGRPKIGLDDIPRLTERLDEGGEVPSGECPKCGALCYKIKKSKQPKQSNKFCLCGHSAAEHHGGVCYARKLSKEGVIVGICSCDKYTEMCEKKKKKAAPKYDAKLAQARTCL